MGLDCIDTQLTKSWRFGPNIAKMANIPLFAKEHSLQTTGKKHLWVPYRVQGARKGDEDEQDGGTITTKSLLKDWQKYKPLVLIGSSNHGLMTKAMDLLGLSELKHPPRLESSDPHDIVDSTEVEDGNPSQMLSGNAVANLMTNMGTLPRFHINGKGESSGPAKWRKATRQIRHLYELASNTDETGCLIPMELPASEFKDFAHDGPLTWDSFRELCAVREIETYNTAIAIVATYDRNTLLAMDAFESHVLGDKTSEEEADIILSTTHAAKGLEWEHVEICEDLVDLSSSSFTDNLDPKLRHPSFLKAMPGQSLSAEPEVMKPEISKVKSKIGTIKSERVLLETSAGDNRKGWQFGFSDYDQPLNALYVALTRARKTLSVPASIKTLLQDFDRYHFLVESYKKDASGMERKMPMSHDESMMLIEKKGEKDNQKDRKMTKGEVWNLYHDICAPLRCELGIPEDSAMLHSLFPECKDEDKYIKGEFKEEHAEQRVKSESQLGTVNAEDDNVADYFDM